MNDFGERLKVLRKAANITQQALADKLNVHLQTISKWERGISEPDISQLGELASVFGISLEKLLGMPEEDKTYVGNFGAEKLGSMIYSCRTASGESQEQLGDELGVSCDAVSRWERSVSCPDINALKVLAEHFNIPVSKLYFGVADTVLPEIVSASTKKARLPIIVLSLALFLACLATIFVTIFWPSTDSTPMDISEEFIITVNGKEVLVEEGLYMPETPVRDGYDFVGWVDGNANDVTFPRAVSEGDVFTSIFVPHKYNVEYWLNGGYFINTPQSTFTVESGTVELAVPQKEGETFEGWFLTPDYSGDKVERVECRCNNVVLYAKWSNTVFTVEYELNGGLMYEPNPYCVTYLDSVVLSEPVRAGYIFLGWYDEPQGGKKVEIVGGENAKNLTLYALWQELDALFTVYYNLNGGEVEEANPVSLRAGEVHKLNGAHKTGYEFIGWNDKADGSGKYYDYLINLSETLTLYAIYEEKEFVIRYIYEGVYEGEAVNPNIIKYGQSVTLLPVFLYGHEFMGWYDSEEGGNKVEVIDSSNIISVSLLYARFKPNEFVIRLDAGEGVFSTDAGDKSSYTFTVTFGESLQLPECTLGGYVFLGWEDEDGFIVTEINVLNIRNISLTAKWRASDKSYEISYILNGGKLENENPDNVLCGQRIFLSDPVREDYIFIGWYDNADGNGSRYYFTPSDREEDLILYAIWQRIVVSGGWEDFAYEKNSTSVTITAYVGAYGENINLVIPSVIDGLPVVEIKIVGKDDTEWRQLKSVTIPEGVVVLGENAFKNLKIIEPLVIPASVERIEEQCFQYSHLSELKFTEGSKLKSIGASACMYLTIDNVVELPYGLERIGERAFYMAKIHDIILPDTLKIIESQGLYVNRTILYYDFVNSLVIPASVEYIGAEAINARYVYMKNGKDITQNFSSSWYNNSVIFYDVQPVELKLHVDDTVYTLNGNCFILQYPEKSGYTFLGWQNDRGEFVRRTYTTLAQTDLYAVFEPKTDTDGRGKGSMAVLEANINYTFTVRNNVSIKDELYFVPNVSDGAHIIIECTGMNISDDGMYYVSPNGEEKQIYSDTVVYRKGGYFVFYYNYVFSSKQSTIIFRQIA